MNNSILVVGLGNPEYTNTYHNAGSDILHKFIMSSYNIKKIKHNLYCGNKEDKYIFYYMCPDMMNISGPAISKIYKYYKCSKLIVIVDDLDSSPGMIRIKQGMAANGHNGLRSIISSMPNIIFIKIVVGIGRPDNMSVSNFVLSERSNEYNEILYHSGLKSLIDILSILV